MPAFPIELTNDFEVEDYINGGSYGTVYKVIKKSNGKIYAMKAVVRTASSWKDIETELQVLSWVNPYKLQLECFYVDGDKFFMIIDYCRNGDLLKAICDKIHDNEEFKEDEIWKYFIQICIGLESLHYNRFIHRDLHPQNILLDENNDIKIADFGISRLLPTKTVQGVPAYYSPRTHSGDIQTQESDVWGIGCILYFLCNLEHPFDSNPNKIINEPHKPIRSQYSDELKYIVDWCLRKQRGERPTILDILSKEFIVQKAQSLGIKIPQTSVMNAAVIQILLNKEWEKNKVLKKRLSKCQNDNKMQKEEIESQKAEITRLGSIIEEINRKLKTAEETLSQNILNSMTLKKLRDKSSEIFNRPNAPELEQEFRRTCSSYNSVQDHLLMQAYQDYTRIYHQKTSIYSLQEKDNRTNLLVCNTENESAEAIVFETLNQLNNGTCIAQLPNGKLFCFGAYPANGIALIIGANGEVQNLPSWFACRLSSAIYFNKNIYCFGGIDNCSYLNLSLRFDLEGNQWIRLAPLPESDWRCNSIIFHQDILISGYNYGNLLRYSINNNSFNTIPYEFAKQKRKILINAEKLYLIECNLGSIYESEIGSDTNWRRIADSPINFNPDQVYCAYNKGAIYIGFTIFETIKHCKFNLNTKRLTEFL